MSWSEIRPSRAEWRRFAVLLLALLAGGCFQPLYGEAAHPGLVADLQAIAVEPVKAAAPNGPQQNDLDRIDHYLGNDLIANLNGTGVSPEPKYRLTVTTSFQTATPTISSQIEAANAATVTVVANYTLMRAGGGETMVTGAASNVTVYDRTAQRFANLRALRDSEIRLAKSLADEIELRLAAYLGDKK